MADAFFEDDSRLLTPHAFEFVLDGEMKRAVRSQNYLTSSYLQPSEVLQPALVRIGMQVKW